jgi:signal transduction histidine kinase/ligand-binding sensor domain-containing protein
MPINRWTLAAAFLLLCAGSSGFSASPRVRYTLDRVWTTYDGLPDDAVIALRQTRDGYLWLGTLHGLARFDGVRFSVFKQGDVPGLNSSRIVKIFEDSHTNLWLGTDTADVFRVEDGTADYIGVAKGAREGRLMSICEDPAGDVLVFAASGQWVQCDGGSLPLAYTNTLLAKSDFVLASSRGGYWRLADHQIQKCRADTTATGPAWEYPWTNSPVSSACEDRDGNLIVGTLGEGVFWFDPAGKATQLTRDHGLSSDFVLSLCVDHEGTLWVGTDGDGLDRVKPQVFEVLEGTRGALVQSACADGQGGLWFGINYGINNGAVGYWKDGVLHQFTNTQAMVHRTVRAVLAENDQLVWVGTLGGLFPLQSGGFGPNVLPEQASAIPQQVSAIYEDRHGLLWVGTQGGLACWDRREWRTFTTRDGLAANAVHAVMDDGAGNLWVGTEGGGLSRLRDGVFTTFTTTNGLPGNNIFSLYLDNEGVLWVGTDSGLGRFDGTNWCGYSKREGLVSDSISYLLEDGRGYLWIGSDAGLMRVRKEALNNFTREKTRTVPVRAYGNPDGLPTGRCTFGSQPGAVQAADGTLWFPTIKGLVSVDPGRLLVNTNPPLVVIESAWVDNELQTANSLRAPPPRAVTVPAGKEALDIFFTSLNLSAPEKTSFRYRLEHHETGWTHTTSANRKAHYTRLSPGHYTFQVDACNEDGVWSASSATLAVTVLPPFWLTWWFLTLATGGILGLIVGSVHYVSTQRLQRQLESLRQKEALEKERARIARDIHDQVGANLTQVSLLGELVESDKERPEEVVNHARQISQTALETTRALDEIVWTVNPANDTLDGLVNYICKYTQEYLALAGLRYRLEVPERLPNTPITPELRHNVFLVAKEAVNNVVKHARATSTWLRLQPEPTRFVLEIEDNGRGLAEADEKKGRNGLRNMRKRMEDIGGQFEIGPGSEGGTRVRLVAPLPRASH